MGVLVVVLLGCGGESEPAPAPRLEARRAVPPAVEGTNVLVVMVDDIAPQHLAIYGVHPNQAPTPTIDRLGAEGVRFDHVWGFPTCTPARAAAMTGRWPSRMGMNMHIEADEELFSMPLSEVTLPEMFRTSPFGYQTSMIGKWHLVTEGYRDSSFHPLDHGFHTFYGSMENLGYAQIPGGGSNTFDNWEKSTNGVLSRVQDYAPTVNVDDTLHVMDRTPEPWFIFLAFNSAHVPYHVPPEALVPSAADLECVLAQAQCFRAAVEAMDLELGRLLDTMDPAVLERTTIVFTGDNGSARESIAPPFDFTRAKGTLFDGGVGVPLVVTGPLVDEPGSSSQALVSLVDLYPTLADLAGVDPAPLSDLDGISFAGAIQDPSAPSARPYLFSRDPHPNGIPPWALDGFTVTDGTWKLIRQPDDVMYRYVAGALDEGDPLDLGAPDVAAAHVRLSAELDRFLADSAYEGP